MNNFSIPPQLINMMRSGGNPQNILMNMIGNSNNPMYQNVISMINNKDSKGIEQFAKNLCQSKGINIDDMFKQIQQNLR